MGLSAPNPEFLFSCSRKKEPKNAAAAEKFAKNQFSLLVKEITRPDLVCLLVFWSTGRGIVCKVWKTCLQSLQSLKTYRHVSPAEAYGEGGKTIRPVSAVAKRNKYSDLERRHIIS